MSDEHSRILGDFLKTRRRRIAPAAGARARRTPGLRREDVAEAAGIGVDWYTRLEQGRGGRPSPATLERLIAALRLDPGEARHLRELAQSERREAFAPETAPPALVRMLEGLAQPAYISGRRWDVLAANAAAQELLPGLAGARGNVVLFTLLDPVARELFEDWEGHARRIVAQFRVAYDSFAGDPAFEEIVAQLAGCPQFSSWWQAHDVRVASSGVKRMRHPRLGWIDYDYAAFRCNEDPALKLTVHTPQPPLAPCS